MDGVPLNEIGETADGLHPGDAGMDRYAHIVLSTIGGVSPRRRRAANDNCRPVRRPARRCRRLAAAA